MGTSLSLLSVVSSCAPINLRDPLKDTERLPGSDTDSPSSPFHTSFAAFEIMDPVLRCCERT